MVDPVYDILQTFQIFLHKLTRHELKSCAREKIVKKFKMLKKERKNKECNVPTLIIKVYVGS